MEAKNRSAEAKKFFYPLPTVDGTRIPHYIENTNFSADM